jgi:glycosyltransferase involved in cell wall biosynthesis
MDERLLLISPVRDEAAHIDAVVAGIEAQVRPPDLWVVVDDGSTDGTREKLDAHDARLPYMRVVSTPPGFTREGGDRLAAAAPDRAWNFGLRQVDPAEFTHLGKLDGDIVLPPEFLAGMLDRFREDPSLGMAGGAILEPDGAEWQALRTPSDHVTAPARLYSRACFEAIGGMPERLGADVITTTYAKLKGFRTATFADLPVRHLRHIGTAQGALRGRARHGAYQYIVHYSLAWIALRSLMVSLRFRPYGLSGLWFLGGYVGAALRGVERVDDAEFRAFARAEQRRRLGGALMRVGLGGVDRRAAAESGDRRERLREAILLLEDHGNRQGWIGPDPYEGLNATRFTSLLRRTPLGRRLVVQAVKRSPLDLRPLLGIAPTRNAATVAWAVSAYARGSFLPPDLQRERLDQATALLASMRLPDWEEACWSYPFDTQSRVFFYAKTDPNTIATSFAGMALIDAFERTGEARGLELARSVARFLVANVPQTEDPPGARFGYLVGDDSPIHNANTHVCALLARLVAHGSEEYRDAIRAGLSWTIERQRVDGSWPYGERGDLDWVDGFHTGYVLDALRTCADTGVDERAEPAWRRGLEYWRTNLFAADGTPKYYDKETYPIDTQCAAQGIQTLALASAHDPSCLEQAWRVFEWTMANMRRDDGLFYFQRRRHWINRVPHMRWTETCMYLALVHLLEADERLRSSPALQLAGAS